MPDLCTRPLSRISVGWEDGSVAAAADPSEPRGEPRDRMSGQASVTLFSGRNLSGRAFPIGE